MFDKVRNILGRLRAAHEHPVSRILTTIGIPAILGGLAIMPLNASLGGSAFVLGWILVVVAHALEGRLGSFVTTLKDLVWPRAVPADGAEAAAAASPN